TTVEPDAWDWGQVDHYGDDEASATARVTTGSGGGAVRGRRGGASAPRRAPARYVEPVLPAVIRHWRDVLIVVAPDYIHRQLGGVEKSATGTAPTTR
ncbi:MAG: hypothetical protein ACYTGP_12575, partial [Planctomycetota bacterium]